jgi:hypothetical protein
MVIGRASSLLCAALAIAICSACDDASNSIGGVDTVRANSSVFLESPSVHAVGLPDATCPGPLFVAPFNLIVAADSRSDLFVTQMQMQFVDRDGIRSPERTITRAGLVDRFGTMRIVAAESRRFPLEFPFGCVGAPQGTLTVAIGLADSQQRERQTSVAMIVR